MASAWNDSCLVKHHQKRVHQPAWFAVVQAAMRKRGIMQRMRVAGFAFFALCLGISAGPAVADEMVAPAAAKAPSKWVKDAPFPEPSEELVGGSVSGKFYVFGGLAPGWIPQGWCTSMTRRRTRGRRKNRWHCRPTMSPSRSSMESSMPLVVLFRPSLGHRPGYQSTMSESAIRRRTAGRNFR